jgi:hypothetical protein
MGTVPGITGRAPSQSRGRGRRFGTVPIERVRKMVANALLGVCGLYCGACYHYRASFPEGEHLLEEATRQGRSLEGFACKGCRSDSLYVHPGCAECRIRACAETMGIIHCGLCVGYPCAQLKGFQSDGRPHHADIFDNLHALKALGAQEWLATQESRWTCTCGTAFSWYEERCSSCGKSANSYGRDPRA